MFGLDGEWVQGVGGFGCVEGVGKVGVFEFGGESGGEEGGRSIAKGKHSTFLSTKEDILGVQWEREAES